MAADEIMGISGQLDISDIQKSLDALFNGLDELGIKSDSLSARMTKALNEIAQSSDTNSKSAQQAFKDLGAILTEAQDKLMETPKKIQSVSTELSNATKTLDTLKDKLSKATAGTAEWDTVNKMLENQVKTVGRLQTEYTTLTGTFSDTQTAANVLNAALGSVNAGRSIANASTGLNAGLHAGVAAAVGAESAAHGVNAEKIGTETNAVNANTEAYQKAEEASRQSTESKDAESAALDKLTQRVLQGKTSEEEYIRAKEDAERRYQQLMDEQTDLLEKEKKLREEANTFKVVDGNIIEGDNSTKAAAADALLERARNLRGEADAIGSSLQRLTDAYTSMTQTAETGQKKEAKATDDTTSAIKAKKDELKKLNEELKDMEMRRDNSARDAFFSAIHDFENPFKAVKRYYTEGDAINEKKQQIADVTAQLEKLGGTAESVKTATSDMWSGMSKSDIATTIQENIAQLKILKSEYSEIVQVYGKNSDKAQDNKQRQEEITREIIQGKEKLREMGTSYEDVAKEAKNAAKNTKKIGDNAKESTSKVKGIIDKIKTFFSKGLSLDGILGMVFSQKGAALAGVTAVAGGMKWLTQQAESLRVAMMPLKTYLDEGTLEDLREQFIALEYESSHSAEEMAAAGTRWVKYFKGLRNNEDAISDVVESSNDFATVLGITSEKAADYQLKIAGAYHQTALEAKGNSTVIINATKGSTVKYEEMAQALAQAANRAQNAGISFKELAAATTYGTSTFGSASEAANTYVMMMTRLSTQSKNEYNPTVVGATKALQNLAKSQNMNNTLTSLLGKRHASLAKIFVQNAADIAKMKDGLDDEASAAAALAGAESKVENVEKRLQNAKKALAHEINANLTPAYASFLEKIVTFIKYVGAFSSHVKSAVAPVVDAIGGFINKLDSKFSNSKFFKYISKFNLLGVLSGIPLVPAVSSIITVQGMRDERKKSLKKMYDENLKKYGTSSPGKAYLAALRVARRSKENYSEDELQYLKSLMNTTRTENKARVTGDALALGGANSITGNKEENKLKKQQEQQRKFREEEAEREARALADSERVKWDLYIAEQESGIARMTDANEKENAQRRLDFEKKKHEIEMERKSFLQQNTQNAKSLYDKNPENKDKEGFYALGLDKKVRLTDDQARLIQTKLDTLNAEKENEDKKYLELKLAKWDDYVEKYGSIQQRIYAITEEYKRKIDALRGSGDEIGASAAENEMMDKIEGLQMQQAKDSIDWDSVFQDLESHSTQYLEKLREQLKKLLSSGTLKIDDMKVVSDQINNVDDAINKQKASWGIVNESVRKYKRLVEEAKQAQLMLNEAQKEQVRAGLSNTSKKIDIQTMLASMGIDATLDSITYKDKDKYFSQVADPQKHEMLKKAFDELGVTEVRLAKSTDELTKAQQKAEAAKDKAKKTPKQMAEDFASGIQGVLDKIQDLPNLLSSIGLGNSGFAKSVGHGIEAMSSAKNAATDFATGNYIGAAYNSISAIQSFGKMFGIGSGNYAEVAKRTKELTDSNQRLQYSIEQLKSSIDKSSGMRAVSNYQEAYKAQEAVNSQTMDILRTQMGYHGAHHSNAYYWNLSAQDYAAINKTLAQQSAIKGGYTEATVNSVGSLEDIYKLTPEQMNDIRTYNQDVWKNMLEQGEYNKSEYWEKYTELAGKLEELTEQINQNLTQTSFDSMKNDFISSLTDMNKSAQDFADNFTAMLNKSMLNFAVGKLMDEKLKPLYEKWASKMKENGGRQLTPEEIDDMRKEYQNIVNEGMKERDTIAAVTRYAEAQSRQTATTKAITAITADQASTLTGIGYAMQSALEHGNDTRTQMAVDISIMRGYAETVAMNMSEMRDIQYEGLGQLQQIVKNTAPIILIREDIAGMYKLMKDRY